MYDNMAFWDYEAPLVRYTHLVQSYLQCVQKADIFSGSSILFLLGVFRPPSDHLGQSDFSDVHEGLYIWEQTLLSTGCFVPRMRCLLCICMRILAAENEKPRGCRAGHHDVLIIDIYVRPVIRSEGKSRYGANNSSNVAGF
jgi:hypothetical protein